MKKKISFLSLVLAVCLIFPVMVLFAGCGKSKLHLYLLEPKINGETFVQAVYGNNEGLDDIKVYGTYSDNTTKEVALSDLALTITYRKLNEENGTVISLEDYIAKVQSNSLDCGSYYFMFVLEDFEAIGSVVVDPAEDVGKYKLVVKSSLNPSLELNHIKYGTKMDTCGKFIYKVGDENPVNPEEVNFYQFMTLNNNIAEPLDVSSMSVGEIALLPVPKNVSATENYVLSSTDYIENQKPGTYLVCAQIKADSNHNSTYTDYTSLTIEKADVSLEASKYTGSSEIEYAGDNLYVELDTSSNSLANLTFEDIIRNSSTKIYGKLKLVLKSDGDSSNDNYPADTKLTEELVVVNEYDGISWLEHEGDVGYYGDLVDISNATYNSQTDCYEITVKFVINTNHSVYYNNSNTIKISLKLK